MCQLVFALKLLNYVYRMLVGTPIDICVCMELSDGMLTLGSGQQEVEINRGYDCVL